MTTGIRAESSHRQEMVAEYPTMTPATKKKKKKKQTTSKLAIDASRQHVLDRLDLCDPPIDPESYQAAIRAHLAEFDQNHDFAGDDPYSDEEGYDPNGYPLPLESGSMGESHPSNSKKKKKKKKKSGKGGISGDERLPQDVGQEFDKLPRQHQTRGKDRIWNTTTNEERERIKEFWLQLGEEERKSLVKIEKEAVLKKMKEQQKHSCSCSVCGRKRTAIEEELEVLYDAYYEELEQYANQQQHFPSPHRSPPSLGRIHPPKITELSDGEGSFDDDEEYSDDELSEEDEEDDYEDQPLVDPQPAEFFKFGNSLTVKGGILTVADDLLKNDGKKFIEMMEQLAERRMQREEEAAMEPNQYEDEEDDEEYDDEELDSDEYDDDEEVPFFCVVYFTGY